MKSYSKEEIKDLRNYLEATTTGKNLANYLGYLEEMELLEFGLSYEKPASTGSARAVYNLGNLYPEIVTALFKTPYEDLPAHVNDGVAGLVSTWRLIKGNKKEPSS